MNPSVPPPSTAAPPDPTGTPIAADAAHVESLRPVAYLELKAAMLLLALVVCAASSMLAVAAEGTASPLAAVPVRGLSAAFALGSVSPLAQAQRGDSGIQTGGMCNGGSLPFWPNVFAKFMAACYLVLMVLAGVQLLRTVMHRHKTMSFRFGFLLVCWAWTALRVLFW